MTAYSPSDWSPETLAALSPQIREDMERPALEGGSPFPERFADIQNVHRQAYFLGASLLAKHGRPGYLHQAGGREYVRDPLTTGFMATGDALYVTRGSDTGICVPAIRVGLEDSRTMTNPLQSIGLELYRKPKTEHFDAKLDAITKHTGIITVRAALLATRKEDIDPDNAASLWSKIIREKVAPNSFIEAWNKFIYNGTYSSSTSYIEETLSKKPDLSMWSIQLPDMTTAGHTSEALRLHRNLLPESSPNSVTGVYDQMSETEYIGLESRLPAIQMAKRLLKQAEELARPVRELGSSVCQPTPEG